MKENIFEKDSNLVFDAKNLLIQLRFKDKNSNPGDNLIACTIGAEIALFWRQLLPKSFLEDQDYSAFYVIDRSNCSGQLSIFLMSKKCKVKKEELLNIFRKENFELFDIFFWNCDFETFFNEFLKVVLMKDIFVGRMPFYLKISTKKKTKNNKT